MHATLKCIDLNHLFTIDQIIYLQGVLAGVQLKFLYGQTNNNLSRARESIEEIFEFTEKDQIPLPLVLIMWSPYYKIQAFSGKEALPFMRPFYQMAGIMEPPIEQYDKATERLVGISRFNDPKVAQFKADKLKFWIDGPKPGPSEIFRTAFKLERTKLRVTMPIFSIPLEEQKAGV